MKYSIVVPCYNEAEVLPLFRQRLDAVLADPQFSDSEVILIDDGSSDATWQLIQDFCAEDKKYKGLSLSRNFGHQLALSAGLKHSIGELVFVCDADLQDPPELLPAMLNTMIEQQADVVYGVRKERSKETWFKKISANFFYRLLAKLSDCHIPRDTGDCRLMRRVIVEILDDMPERDRFIRGMIAWMGFRQVPHFYDRPGREAGVTKYTLRRMLSFATDALMGFSMAPLRSAVVLSGLMLLSSLIIGSYTIYSWAFLNVVPGWVSTMLVVSLISSMQFLILGVLGEYVGRIYMGQKHRPLYIVGQKANIQ